MGATVTVIGLAMMKFGRIAISRFTIPGLSR